jgi:[ribosomal protein S5]-alanine N-acetyltransferase
MEVYYEGIVLRPWSIDDAVRLASIADNKNIGDKLRDGFPFPYSTEDAVNWLESILPENIPPRFFAILENGIVVGSIGIVSKTDIYRKNFEIGYFLDEKFWGRGIITRAIKAATSYAFNNFDVIRIYAEPFADNQGSRRALEKAGYTLEATLKNYVVKNDIIKDSCIYSVLREEYKYNV